MFRDNARSASQGSAAARARGARRARAVFALIALILMELGAKVLLFADVRGVLRAPATSSGRRIWWVRSTLARHRAETGAGGAGTRFANLDGIPFLPVRRYSS